MKKLVLVLLVAMLSVPAFAADPNITISAAGSTVTVGYADSNAISGMGLTVTLSSGTISSFTDLQGEAGKYNIHPSYLKANPSAINTGTQTISPHGTPVVSGGNTFNNVVVEYGCLYKGDANAPATSGNLFSFAITGGTSPVTVTVSANHAGGIVTKGALAQFNIVRTKQVTLVTDCYKTTSPDYSAWVTFGKPDCWCYQRNCRGDINGVKNIYWVSSHDLTIFKTAYNKNDAALLLVTNGICADLNRTKNIYRVSSHDLTIFKVYYNKNDASTPICDSSLVNAWKN